MRRGREGSHQDRRRTRAGGTTTPGGSSAAASVVAIEGVGATSGVRSTDPPREYEAPDQASATTSYVEEAPAFGTAPLRQESPWWTSPEAAFALQSHSPAAAHFPPPGPFRLVAEKEAKQGYGYPQDSYMQIVAISIVLASFGQIVESTGDRPRIATTMVVIAIAFLIWSTPMFFLPRFGVLNSWALAGLLVIILALVATYIWIIVRIWDP